jgi:hypothetical protein
MFVLTASFFLATMLERFREQKLSTCTQTQTQTGLLRQGTSAVAVKNKMQVFPPDQEDCHEACLPTKRFGAYAAHLPS